MIRQEAINVHLADLLCGLGLKAAAERVKRLRKSPDLTIIHPTFGVMLGEAELGDSWADNAARRKLEARAQERFSDSQFNYIDFVLMVVYPKALLQEASSVSEREIINMLARSEVGVGLAYRAAQASLETTSYSWYPDPVHPTQIPAVLEDLAKGTLGAMLKPGEVTEQIINLIEEASRHVLSSARFSEEEMGFWLEVAHQLEIDVDALEDKSMGAYLAAKMLFTLIAVSVIIYEVARIRYPSRLFPLPSPTSFHSLAGALNQLSGVNYVEVVDSVRGELLKAPSEPTLTNILDRLCAIIRDNISVLMRSGWESLAMIYQRLLSETYRKAYATFYTKLLAARLLSELSIEGPWDAVIDPAEGTGSLLISSFYVRQWLALKPSTLEETLKETSSEPAIDKISKALLKKTCGMDALRAAVALSCAGLTIASLAVPHERLSLFHTPVGAMRSGSLDLLINRSLLPDELSRALGTFDLAIMNPPFTRSDRIPALIGDRPRRDLTDKKLTFGGEELSNLFAAGLAKPFLVLAESLVHERGRIAAVLPSSILNRSSWVDVRRGIARAYNIEYVVASWGAGAPNFSSDTVFREILIVLGRGRNNRPVTVINLLEPVDKLDVRDIATIAHKAKGLEGSIVVKSEGEAKVIAKIAKVDQRVVEEYSDNLYRLIAFLSPELLEWHIKLIESCCMRLGDLFEIGSVIDHTDGLRVMDGAISEGYPAVWGSGCEVISGSTLDKPTHSIIIESESKAKVKFWREKPKAKTFFFSDLFTLRRGQLDTQSALSFKTSIPVASNVWWPLKPKDQKVIPAFLAFMNSTFGFIYLLGERLETRGLYVEYKKEHLENMPILDLRKIDAEILEACPNLPKARLPRFDRYFKVMAKLEDLKGSWMEAADQAILEGGELAPRAALDKAALVLLSKICPNLKSPSKLYKPICEDVEKLRGIMEHGREVEEEPIKDTGELGAKREKTAPLDKWIKTDLTG